MVTQESPQLPPPPGIVPSLTAGFDAIATNITTILLPILLDLFIWLGPRLQIDTLIKPLIAQTLQLARQSAFPGQDIQQAQVFWDRFAQTNLVGNLRTFPIGVASLLASSSSTETPFGHAPIIEVSSFFYLLGWTVLFIFTGWLFGSVFFFQVSKAALKRSQTRTVLGLLQAIFQTLLLNISWWTLVVIAAIPIALFIAILTFISTGLAQFFVFFIGLLLIWLLLPVYFSTHGIFVYGQNAFSSIMQSLRLVRFTMPSLSLFALMLIIISEGLSYLWRVPQSASWFTLVGIVAHSFISSALLAASFIYYRDMNAWLQIMLEKIRTQTTSARA